MAFIRRKISNGICYYDIAESFRENGQVKKRIIVSLGRCPSIAEAIRITEIHLRRYLVSPQPARARDRHKAEKLRRRLEILRNVVTKSAFLQTFNYDYIETLAL
jgi:hypothetical protein